MPKTLRPRSKPRRKGENPSEAEYSRVKALRKIQQQEREASEKRASQAEVFLLPVKNTTSALEESVKQVPFTGEEYQQAAESQRQDKVLKWHDIETGMEAALTAQLMTDLGYPLLKGGFNWLKNKAVSPAARYMTNPENFIFEGPLIKPIMMDVPSLEETLKSLQPSLGGSLVELLPRKPLTGLPQPKLQLRLPAYDAHAQLDIAPQDAGLTDVTDGDLFGIRLADTALKRPIKISPHDMPSGLFENLSGHSAESAANNLYQQYIENLPFWQSHGVRPPLPYITSVGDESLSVGFRPQWYKMIGTPNTLQKVAELPAGLPESVATKRLPEPARNQLDNMMGNGTDFDLFDEWLGPEAMSQSLLENRALATQALNDIADRARFNANVSTLKDNGLISGRHAAALKHAEDPSKYWSLGVEKSALRKAVPQYFKDIKLTKQKDYAKRVIEARKLEESVNSGLNDRAYALYSDLQGSIKPLQSLNSLINDAGRMVGQIRSIGDIVEDTFKNYQAWKTDPNPGGWQLKYLMRGNKLERQLSKDGTISVNSINDQVKNGSDIEKYVTEKVLNEKFAGQSKVNYVDFKHAVQDELVTYRTQQSHAWENYGMDRIGYSSFEEGEHINAANDPLGIGFTDIVPRKSVQLDTYTFSSPRINKGNMLHYASNTLGHSRTFVSKEEPEVMHVMESLSDWGQKGRLTGHYETDMHPYGSKDNPLSYHEKHLMKNWESRQIQENMIHAADKGLTKMRYPTKETAAKIEGYSQEGGEYWDVSVRAERGDTPYTDRIIDLEYRLKAKEFELSETTGQSDIEQLQKEIDKIKRNIDRVKGIEERFKAGEVTYNPDHETILDKYKLFPKEFKKLYKNAEVREVTDAKGNTWYEVDIPKNMRKRERAYSIAGTIIAGGTAASTLKPRKKQ